MKFLVSDSLISIAQQELLALLGRKSEQKQQIQIYPKQMKSPVFGLLIASVQLVLVGLVVQEIERNRSIRKH
jgi:ABC-type enterochelin transport system permease subunit